MFYVCCCNGMLQLMQVTFSLVSTGLLILLFKENNVQSLCFKMNPVIPCSFHAALPRVEWYPHLCKIYVYEAKQNLAS